MEINEKLKIENIDRENIYITLSTQYLNKKTSWIEIKENIWIKFKVTDINDLVIFNLSFKRPIMQYQNEFSIMLFGEKLHDYFNLYHFSNRESYSSLKELAYLLNDSTNSKDKHDYRNLKWNQRAIFDYLSEIPKELKLLNIDFQERDSIVKNVKTQFLSSKTNILIKEFQEWNYKKHKRYYYSQYKFNNNQNLLPPIKELFNNQDLKYPITINENNINKNFAYHLFPPEVIFKLKIYNGYSDEKIQREIFDTGKVPIFTSEQ